MVKLRQASADFTMNAESLLHRSRILWGVFIAATFFLSLHSTALAQGRTVRGEATVEAPDGKKKVATFVVDAKSGSRKAPERLTFPVLEDCVYREVTSTRKVRASSPTCRPASGFACGSRCRPALPRLAMPPRSSSWRQSQRQSEVRTQHFPFLNSCQPCSRHE
jgi:ribosomal protein L32